MELEQLILGEKLLYCKKCGGKLKYDHSGIYICESCGEENISDYGKVKLYLSEHGTASIQEIVRATGVRKDAVELFLQNGRIEVSSGADFLKCERCGISIRSGRICLKCMELENSKNNKTTKSSKGKMYHLGKTR